VIADEDLNLTLRRFELRSRLLLDRGEERRARWIEGDTGSLQLIPIRARLDGIRSPGELEIVGHSALMERLSLGLGFVPFLAGTRAYTWASLISRWNTSLNRSSSNVWTISQY